MPIAKGDQLFSLVKSLTKSEKRSLKAFSTRLQEAEDLLYMQLFDILEKQTVLDEEVIIKKLGISDRSQFTNLKRHLYKQILSSLRLIELNKNDEIQIREYIDFSDILYSRGLYLQSLKILEKAKHLSSKTGNDILYLSVVEKEKTIESRHITRSGPSIVPALVEVTNKMATFVNNTTRLSNLRILLHGYYIQKGHVRNQQEEADVRSLFEQNMPNLLVDTMNYQEQIFYHQSQVWYHYILLDFENCYQAASLWIQIFEKETYMKEQDADLYMRGYHYLLTSCLHLRKADLLKKHLADLEKFREDHYHKFNQNSKIISFLYVHHSRMNHHFLEGSFRQGLEGLKKTKRRLTMYQSKLDAHHVMVFNYKIAWMHLMAGEAGMSIKYLNEIIQMEMGALREDIQGYARLMFLMAHYDLGNYELMPYLLRQATSFFGKMKETNRFQKETMAFFGQLTHASQKSRNDLLKAFKAVLLQIQEEKYEKRAFLYLDLPFWVDMKLNNK